MTINWPNFTLRDYGVEKPMNCKFTDWPISTPVATGECEDGSRHSIEIHADKVIFDGYPLTQTFEAPD